ncbi:hypothetical protein [Brachybacterium sp. ACRRE]|uniref:hypothetical protein n=1 Tax=Brachybacterium sp. ACRRE TaxID=2918184 RepID=UPI001EF1BF9B|nr:hypothetical protein [Brachybacterium sp. ACRRE]MCG7309431.1 hypothetical protein [Brachybacterium sp. ACRRE]
MRSRTRKIGLLADLGAPETIASRIADAVAARVSECLGEETDVEVGRETLPLSPDGSVHLAERAPALRRRHEWDCVVYLSDLPDFVDGRPLLAEAAHAERCAQVTVPAMGGLRLAARTRDLLVGLILAILQSDQRHGEGTLEEALGAGHRRVMPSPDRSGLTTVVLEGRLRTVRLLGGMVRSNRPGRLLPALTGCIAAAVGAGAFGVFYGTLAPVADPLSLWRLGVIALLAGAILTVWLIVRNRLWNSASPSRRSSERRLDNAATVLTVGFSVAMLYIVLAVLMLLLSVTVLDPVYLHNELLHPAGAMEYVKLAWLSASMGALAGSLGANFDDESAVRSATFSRRYDERRRLFDQESDDQSSRESRGESGGDGDRRSG